MATTLEHVAESGAESVTDLVHRLARDARAAQAVLARMPAIAREHALKLAADDVAYVPLYRRTLNWVMQKNVHVVMLPDDTIPVRWVSVR